MSKVLVGRATVYGIDGTVAHSGIATTKTQIQGLSFQHEVDSASIKGTEGSIIAMATSGDRQSLNIDYVPTGAPGDASYAAGQTAIQRPANLALVTLAGFNDPDIDGNWNFSGQYSTSRTVDGFIRASMSLVRCDGDALPQITGEA